MLHKHSMLTLAPLAALLLLGAAALPAHAECDTAGPVLTLLTLDKTSVNTTTAAQNVVCTMNVNDSPAGVASATCLVQYVDLVNPGVVQTQSCNSTTPSAGTPQNGTYTCTITMPRYSDAGLWNTQATFEDAVTNSSTYSWFQMPPGSTMNLSVTSDPDVIAPAFGTVTLNPTTVNVSSASQNVTCSMPLTDAKSGVSSASCFLQAPSTSSTQAQGCTATAPSSGTRNNGTFSCTITMPRYSDAGTWTTLVLASDAVGNRSNGTPPATLTVTASPEDIIAPTVAFDFNPKSIDVSASPQTVTCTFTVTDALAGVNFATCDFSYSDPLAVPPINQSQTCTATAPSSGTRNNGTFSCVVTIPARSAGGNWTPTVNVADVVGNVASPPQAQVLAVSCAASEAETTIRFSNKTTLTWTAIAGATRYNIYRGVVTGLTDANHDGLPDGGYGTCQNSRDPNLTDTQFIDTDVPTLAQKGFHYLVDYTTGGVEKGLGKTSAGKPRTVAAPCP